MRRWRPLTRAVPISRNAGRLERSNAACASSIRPWNSKANPAGAPTDAFRGESDPAFEWLDRSRTLHDAGMRYLKYDRFLRSLRGDSRYTALLQKMNLPAD